MRTVYVFIFFYFIRLQWWRNIQTHSGLSYIYLYLYLYTQGHIYWLYLTSLFMITKPTNKQHSHTVRSFVRTARRLTLVIENCWWTDFIRLWLIDLLIEIVSLILALLAISDGAWRAKCAFEQTWPHECHLLRMWNGAASLSKFLSYIIICVLNYM